MLLTAIFHLVLSFHCLLAAVGENYFCMGSNRNVTYIFCQSKPKNIRGIGNRFNRETNINQIESQLRKIIGKCRRKLATLE